MSKLINVLECILYSHHSDLLLTGNESYAITVEKGGVILKLYYWKQMQCTERFF